MRIKGVSRFIRLVENGISFSALAVLVFAVLWGVITRYVTESPAVWTTELSGILFTWVVFIGAMMAFRDGEHIRVTLLLDMLPGNARRFLLIAGDLIVFAFLVYVTWLSLQMMLLGATRASPVLRIPFSWVYLATVISFALMSTTSLLRLLGVIADPDKETVTGDEA